MRLPDAVIGSGYRSDLPGDLLADLVEHRNRMAGSAGERAGAETLVEALAGIDGATDVGTDEFEIPGWWRGDSSLSVVGPSGTTHEFDASHEIVALPGTPAGEPAAELVDVGAGAPADFEAADLDGRIALVSDRTPDGHDRRIHRMEKYADAVEAGAAAFVFRNFAPGALPRTGEVGYHSRPGPIPAVSVSAEVGARLARYCEDAPTEASLAVDCRNEPATSHNVEARVGPDTDEEVLVTAHLDAHDIAEGAADNGAGSVIAVEVARLLAGLDDLDTAVRIVVFGAEEIGLYGAYHYAATNPTEEIRAVCNVDGAGKSRDLAVRTSGFDDLGAVFADVAETLDVEYELSDEVSPHGDQWALVEQGVPAVMASSLVDEAGRGWGHTHADTLDKIDARDLRAQAIVVAEAAARIATGPREIEHRDPEAVREGLDDGYVRELKVGGRWHYDSDD